MLLRFTGGKHIGKKRILRLLLAAAVFFLLSCKGNEKAAGTMLCQVERRDFREVLNTTGITFSENTTTLTVGNDTDGKIAYIVEDGVSVHKGDTLCIIESQSLEQEMENLVTTRKNIEAEMVKTVANYNLEHAINEAHVATGEAEAQISALDSLQLKFSPELQRRISELNLRRASIERERYTRNIKAQEVIHDVDMRRISTSRAWVNRRIAEMQKRIDALVVLAPADGIALIAESPSERRRKLTIGDEVWERCPLIIMPDLEHMQVLIESPENEYKRIDVDDSVQFTFSALPDSMAWGRVIKKMPVGKDVGAGKVKMFEITATIDSAEAVVMPQSTAQCSIQLRMMRDTLVVPSVCVYDRDSLKVVYVHLPGGMAEERVVEIATSSTNEAVLASGVKEGEQLCMLRPDDKRIRKPAAKE